MEDRLNIQELGFTPRYNHYIKDYIIIYYNEGNEIWILKDGVSSLFKGKISTQDELKILLKQIND